MFRFTTARESLDDDHATTAAGARLRQDARLIGCIERVRFALFRGGWSGKQLAHLRDIGGTIPISKQTIVPDAMHAWVTHASGNVG
jgi:hypothetical protein